MTLLANSESKQQPRTQGKMKMQAPLSKRNKNFKNNEVLINHNGKQCKKTYVCVCVYIHIYV